MGLWEIISGDRRKMHESRGGERATSKEEGLQEEEKNKPEERIQKSEIDEE